MSVGKLPDLLRDYVETCREEGVTYTSDPAATLWTVEVRSQHAPPMRASIRATSAGQAHTFARNRHRYASSVHVIDPMPLQYQKPTRTLNIPEDVLRKAQALHDGGKNWREVLAAIGLEGKIAHYALRHRCDRLRKAEEKAKPPAKLPAKVAAAKPKPAKPAPAPPAAVPIADAVEAIAQGFTALAAALRISKS